MQITYFDGEEINDQALEKSISSLTTYREQIRKLVDEGDFSKPESAVGLFKDEDTISTVYDTTKKFKRLKLVIVVGIGGSSLGTEAIHEALGSTGTELMTLDAVAPHAMAKVIEEATRLKRADQLAICVISKSGGTTETLANAEVLVSALKKHFGKAIHKQVVYIGNPDNELLKQGKRLGGNVVAMREAIGGRYSIFTSVGLVPLTLLGHDIEALLSGLEDATKEHYEEAVTESAARLHLYLKSGFRHVNFFGFDTRLAKLGYWYRQLTAESLGKETTRKKKSVSFGFVPTISTPVELHSIGQLYFSGLKGVYTDFVYFDDAENDYSISKNPLIAKQLKGHSLQEIATAIYGGVVGAYQKRNLPYRATALEESRDYSLGLFMGMRMLETMYLAELLDVNAFNQPNVELYKQNSKKILGL